MSYDADEHGHANPNPPPPPRKRPAPGGTIRPALLAGMAMATLGTLGGLQALSDPDMERRIREAGRAAGKPRTFVPFPPQRREKYPGQRTAYLKGAWRGDAAAASGSPAPDAPGGGAA